jgi:hypothetical protein
MFPVGAAGSEVWQPCRTALGTRVRDAAGLQGSPRREPAIVSLAFMQACPHLSLLVNFIAFPRNVHPRRG